MLATDYSIIYLDVEISPFPKKGLESPMKAVFGPHDRETSATGSVFAHLWNESNRLGDYTRKEK